MSYLPRRRLARVLCLALFLVAILYAGMEVRRWTWEKTTHLRFQHDIVNGFFWGSQTLVEARARTTNQADADTWPGFLRGFYALYDRVAADAFDGEYYLDYPPLRLLVMSIWARQVRKEFPGAEDGKPEYVEPLLRVNVFCELLSALGIFLLVRLWVNRAAGATGSPILHRLDPHSRGWICGLAAAVLAWLDPSLILDAHGWPQWDVWILPFYIFAALAASTRRWFLCGVLLAVGGMLKGQLLLVAPFFVVWPLWQRRWERAFRVVVGFTFTFALIAAPWLLQNWISLVAVLLVCVTMWIVARIGEHRSPLLWSAAAGSVAAFIFGAETGSLAWVRVGFLYGSEHYPFLFISSCYNLPSLLSDFGLALKQPWLSAHLGSVRFSFTPQWTLRFLYLATLVLCALGAARHAHRRDARLLIALATPWLLMFAILGQMHERYLLWGGVVSAIGIGVSLRMTVITCVLSLASTAMIAHVMLIDKKLHATLPIIAALNVARPWASWIVLICVALCFCEALSTRAPLFRSRPRAAIKLPELNLDRDSDLTAPAT